ncbi:MAG: 30S ribosomal protein S17 [Ignisphaera sp.]
MSNQPRARNIGIAHPAINPPEKSCYDKKCPWHGHVKVRGKILIGKVIKARMRNTVTVEHEYHIWVRKYRRYKRRRSKIHAHCPPCITIKEGDIVLIGETRPLSKSVSFVVLGILKVSHRISSQQGQAAQTRA